MKLVRSINTKVDKHGTEKVTNLTVDFTDCPMDLLYSLAAVEVIIRTQQRYRTAKNIPAVDTVVVKDINVRKMVPDTPDTIVAKYANFTPDQQKAIFEKLAALQNK